MPTLQDALKIKEIRKGVADFMRRGAKWLPNKLKSRRFRHRKQAQSLNRALPGYTTASPFPPTKGYKLVYEQDGSLTVGTLGVLGTQQKFICNGIFDVDISGGGHQPYGADALKIAYQRYKVNGCRIHVEFYNVQSINAIDISYLISNPSNFANTITGADPDAIGERQMGETITLQNTGAQRRTVTFYLPMAKAFNQSRLQYKADIDNSTADSGSNPASKVGLHLAVADPNGGSVGACRYKLKLTYFITMYQREEMAQS